MILKGQTVELRVYLSAAELMSSKGLCTKPSVSALMSTSDYAQARTSAHGPNAKAGNHIDSAGVSGRRPARKAIWIVTTTARLQDSKHQTPETTGDPAHA